MIAFFVLFVVSFLPNVGAQQAPGDDFHNDIDTYGRYIPSRSAWDQSGKVRIIDSELNYTYHLKAFGKLPVDLSVGSQYISIDNSTSVFLPAHLTGFTTGIETTVPFFGLDKTYFRAGVYPSFYGDNWTFEAANFRIPSKYYAIYKLSDQWIFVAGVAVYPDYDSTVSPIVGVIFKPNDKLTGYFVSDRQNISYALTDKFTLFVEGREQTDDEYIFTNNTTKNAVLKYTEGHLGAGVTFKINKNAEISLSGGEIFMNTFKYLNTNGKIDLKNGPYVELRFQVKI